MKKSAAGVGHQNLHIVSLGGGLKPDDFGFFRVGGWALVFDCLHGKLHTVQYRLAQTLGVAQDPGQRRGNAHAQLDGAAQKSGAVELFHVAEQLGDGNRGELVAEGARDAGKALQRGFHAAGFAQDGFDALAVLRVEAGGVLEQRGKAENAGEGIV